MSDWREGLTHKDWLFDGAPIRSEYGIERFNKLDWSKAWVDLGPSIAGNLGPYWHVPFDEEGTVHRLYPKVLTSKWLLLIRQACEAYAAQKLAGYWQPMITAPKDGSAFLGVWWSDISAGKDPVPQMGVCWWAGGWCPYDRKLTHWQPLPSSPLPPSKCEGE